MKNIFDTIFGQKIFVTISFINLSPIIIVRSGLTSGKAKRMESNIEARGLPSIVGERPDAATSDAKIVPSPSNSTRKFNQNKIKKQQTR